MPGRHIGVVKGIEHRPQHGAFEFERRQRQRLLFARAGILLDVFKREFRSRAGAWGGRAEK